LYVKLVLLLNIAEIIFEKLANF